MASTEWSTDGVAEADGFAFWREEFLPPLGIAAEPDPAVSGPFRAKIAHRTHGPLRHVKTEADPHLVMRRPREIARQARQGYSIYHELGDGCWFGYAGKEFVTNTGDLVITDADAPWESRSFRRYQLETLLVPKILLDPHLPRLDRPVAVRLSGRTGAEALAADYFKSLMREWDRLDPPTMHAMADTFCRLIAVACGAAIDEQPDAARAARLAEAQRYSDRHLADPTLSPARAAAAIGISVRALHLLFEPTGTSFARHVTRRRLAECRAALANPLSCRRTVAEIAFAWGFHSLPTFYRAFHREFARRQAKFAPPPCTTAMAKAGPVEK
jgi:AraC-like DNA-binding protein